jgi:predicted DNA-binding mobile mystery protein A
MLLLASVVMLEKREAKGTATLAVIQKAAEAMHCKLVYALVPNAPFKNLEAIIESRALRLAVELVKKVEHSMQLEKQGSDEHDVERHVYRLARELKETMDSRIWNTPTKNRQPK